MGDYHLTVELTYLPYDTGGGETDPEDKDDSDTEEATVETIETTTETTPASPAAISYMVHASIKCVRGDGTDRNAQYYVMESDYPNVSLTTQ